MSGQTAMQWFGLVLGLAVTGYTAHRCREGLRAGHRREGLMFGGVALEGVVVVVISCFKLAGA